LEQLARCSRMKRPTQRRGRPLDPAVGEAALRVTVELLDEHGYAGYASPT
jgi:hypothetical protein